MARRGRFVEESAALGAFLSRRRAIDAATLSPDKQLDREQLIRAMDAGILANERDSASGRKIPTSTAGA